MKHMKFRTKLIIIICLFSIFIVSAVSFLNYRWYSSQLTRQTVGQTQQIIEQTASNISTYLDELYRLTLAPYYNDSVLNILEHTPESADERLNAQREVGDFLSSVMTLPREEVLRVYLINDETIYSYTRTPYEMEEYFSYHDSDWYREALSTTKPVYIPPHLESAFGEKKTPVFSIVRQIRSKEDNSKILGMVKVDADYTGIRKICDRVELKGNGNMLILNDADQIIYQTRDLSSDSLIKSTNSEPENTNTLITDSTGKKYIFNEYSIESSGLRIIALTSYDELMQPTKNNLEKTISLALSCTVAIIIFVALFIKRSLYPLNEIVHLMKKIEDGNLAARAHVKTQDEIGYLALSFNRMTEHLQEFITKNSLLIKEIYETKYLYKESQYNALCGQMKPHFMYNTLNTINLLIKCGESDKAVHAIEDFSFYLGGIMNVNREISLKNELMICRAYLSIMQLRYEDKLSFDITVDPRFYSYKIPSLTVQPLIENAVKHGCEPRREPTHISLTAFEEGAFFYISATDNGCGMNEQTLSAVQKKIHSIRSFSDSASSEDEKLLGNIGLVNICRRLFLKFGDQADLNISSSSNGTTITLQLPKSIEL